MHIRKSFHAGLIFLFSAVMSGITVAQSAPQDPPPEAQRPSTMTEEQRRRFLEMVREQAAKAEQARRNDPQQQVPAPVPPPPPQTEQGQTPLPATPMGQSPLVQRPALSSDQVQLSYDNADLYDFVNQVADTLGITPIIIDPQVKGSVTIHSSAPMAKEDVFALFNIILKNNNAALVKQAKIYQIVPISDALKRGLEVIEHRPPEPPEKPQAKPPAEKSKEQPGPDVKPEVRAGLVQTQRTESIPSLLPLFVDARVPAAAVEAAAPAVPQPPPQNPPQTPQVPAPLQAPRLSTHVIRAEFVAVRDLIEPLKLFMTEGGVIMPYDRLNMLILTDYTDNVERILELVRLLDNSFLDPEFLELIEIKNNAAPDVLEDLRKIFGSGTKDSPTGVYFVSLDRMNAILVMANSKRALGEVKRWIERLDTTAGRSVQTFIYTVENSTASNIMLVLTALFGGETGAAPQGAAARSGSQGGVGGVAPGAAAGGGVSATPFGSVSSGAQAGMGGFGGGSQFGGFGGGGQFGGYGGQYGGYGGQYGGYGGGVFGAGQQLGPRLNQAPAMSSFIFRGGPLTGLQESARVVANDINNTLVIQSSLADYAYLLEVIKKLDVLPRQVIIDARIFEVDLTDALSFGVAASLQARTSGPHQTTAGIAASNGALTAGTFALVGDAREVLLAIDALRTKTRVKVLEAPSILALDGTVARIVVGGEVPYPAGSFFGATISSSSIQYRDTGISLIVMPRISASGVVTLDIAQEVSSAGAPVPNLGPTFNKTSVATTLSVRDGETVAIAGLIRDSTSTSRSGVPFFSEIPLIGSLFGRSTRNALRTELLILITPHVIRTPERFSELTQELKDTLRNVRKLVDSKERERLEDLEDARKERYKLEERRREQQEEPAPAKRPED